MCVVSVNAAWCVCVRACVRACVRTCFSVCVFGCVMFVDVQHFSCDMRLKTTPRTTLWLAPGFYVPSAILILSSATSSALAWLHFSKLANTETKIVWFSYPNTTGYQKTMFSARKGKKSMAFSTFFQDFFLPISVAFLKAAVGNVVVGKKVENVLHFLPFLA